MGKFKVGDRVRYIKGVYVKELNGQTGKVIRMGTATCVVQWKSYSGGPLNKGNHALARLELVTDKEEKQVQKKAATEDNRQWQFNIRSLEQIDWNEIYNDLSYTNPIALVETQNKYYVVLHESIRSKASALSMQRTNKKGRVYGVRSKAEFKHWIAWAKKVKDAPWPEKYKARVKVVLPRV